MSTAPPHVCRVLVVDDQRDTLLLLETLLTRAGYEVVTAQDGHGALAAVREFAPQAVITDLGLGGELDGLALVDAVRNDPQLANPCFIAITGFDDDDHREQARRAGFDHYLVKPASIKQLQAVLPK